MPEQEITLDQGIQELVSGLGSHQGNAAPGQPVEPDMSDGEAELSQEAATSDAEPESTPQAEDDSDDATPVEEPSDDGKPQGDDGEGDAEEPAEDPIYSFRANGEQVEVSVSELIRDFQGRAGLDKSLARAEQEKQQLAAQQQQLQAEQAKYLEHIKVMEEALQGGQIEDPPEELYQSDPVEYLRRKDAARSQRETLQNLSRKREEEQQKTHEHQLKAFQDFQANREAELLQQVPEWKDSKVYERDLLELNRFGQESGYTLEQLSYFDANATLLLRDAMRFRMQKAAAKPRLVKKAPAPNIPKGRTVKAQPKTATQKEEAAFEAANRGFDAGDPMADPVMAAARLMVARRKEAQSG